MHIMVSSYMFRCMWWCTYPPGPSPLLLIQSHYVNNDSWCLWSAFVEFDLRGFLLAVRMPHCRIYIRSYFPSWILDPPAISRWYCSWRVANSSSFSKATDTRRCQATGCISGTVAIKAGPRCEMQSDRQRMIKEYCGVRVLSPRRWQRWVVDNC